MNGFNKLRVLSALGASAALAPIGRGGPRFDIMSEDGTDYPLSGLGNDAFDVAIASFKRRDSAMAREAYDWAYGRNRVFNAAAFRLVRRRYYHVIGLTSGVTTFRAFNANKAPHITNLPQAGYLDADSVFLATGLAVKPVDISTAGTVVDLTVDDAAVQSALKLFTQYAQGGEFYLRVGQTEVLRANGLENCFPSTGGQFSAVGAPAAGTQTYAWRGSDANGPDGYDFGTPYIIEPEERIEFGCDWPAAVTHGLGTPINLRIELVGMSLFRKS